MQLWGDSYTTAYIGLGSNLGDRAGNLLSAVRCLIEADFVVRKLSPIYETEPVGIETDLPFLNMVAEVRVTGVTPSKMMARLLRIEYLLGRGDKSVKRPRTADLDLLFFGKEALQSEFVTLPHPRAHLRKFVLVPMVDLCPDLVHPSFGMTMSELLNECEDTSWIHKWDPNQGLLGTAASVSIADLARE
ncbi:MAG TPA: 2-amino-4-hydroxy-6-hydroxymethyldihydropteridine diphosphokinase [Pyrinomonadaceae bacterium]|nr:2-amino-4-hydroxy-6-hydroxymethyldihydropteridine diphosphokinase [Pyrinomonadaceae bacterium]